MVEFTNSAIIIITVMLMMSGQGATIKMRRNVPFTRVYCAMQLYMHIGTHQYIAHSPKLHRFQPFFMQRTHARACRYTAE